MEKIRITNNGGGVYEHGEIIEISDLIKDYCDCDMDKSTCEFLNHIPVGAAVKHIAAVWELEYEYIL